MKKLGLILIAAVTIVSCSKTSTTPNTNNNNGNNNNTPTTGCGDGNICFKIDGTDVSKQAGGYELADTNLFVKYEDGNKQLSLDIFGKTTGNYPVSDVRMKGNARIYYFPNGGSNDTFYMAETGSFNVSAYDATGKQISGTFSGTLYNYTNSGGFIKTDSIVIANGEFTKVKVPKI